MKQNHTSRICREVIHAHDQQRNPLEAVAEILCCISGIGEDSCSNDNTTSTSPVDKGSHEFFVSPLRPCAKPGHDNLLLIGRKSFSDLTIIRHTSLPPLHHER
uniref:Uncharacterized protein n=1 Tax=Ditylum brightwellii TaxID=49249 RepID=A0A7S4T5Y6_9STRA